MPKVLISDKLSESQLIFLKKIKLRQSIIQA